MKRACTGSKTRRAFLARDRFGQKPLFFAEFQGRLVFASEIKALLAAGIKPRANLETWSRYLQHASYDDDGSTFFDGVEQLAPGECATWRPGGRLERRTYYNLADHVEPSDITFDAAVRGTRELICDAARVHMRSDVPIAFSLSGGFDSSALLAALDEVDELHKGVACYSVDFGSAFSEQPWIDAAAAHHAVRSHVAEFTATDFRDSIRPMMWHLEAPIGGLMNCAQLAIASAARENGFKVIQDGSGLDEACGGYRNHHNLYLGLLLSQDHQDAQQAVRDYARNWGVDETAAIASARAELNRVSTSIDGTVSTRLDLLAEDFVAQFPGVENRRLFSQDRLKNELIDYLQVRKIPRNTRMRDRTTMAYGIELRLPYLDHRLIEYALGLPGSYYFRHGRTKSIAREAFAGAMDDDVRIAAKRSIQAPQGQWLRQEPMRSYVHDIIESESFADRGLFDGRRVRAAFQDFCTGGYDNSFFVWQWVNVEEWFRIFIDGDALKERRHLCPDLASPTSPITRVDSPSPQPSLASLD